MDRLTRHGIVAGALALVVTGCAGTGGMTAPPPNAPEPETPRAEEERRRAYAAHPEFRNQYGLAQVKAHHAYARGATGEGVTLGIVDTGVDPSHPKFEGKLETDNVEGYAPEFGTCDNRASDGTCHSLLGHGTFVAGIMAAKRRAAPDAGAASVSAIHGVAFDADVISVGGRDAGETLEDILGENPTPEQIRDLPNLIQQIESDFERQIASAFERLNGRVTAVNASFGYSENIEDVDAEALRARFPNVIEAMAQAETSASERTIYVWAAGNSSGYVNADGAVVVATSVDVNAGLPVRIPELRGHSLAVVATDRQGRIAEFSSRCGIAKAFCLAAPGVDITGPVPGVYCAAGAGECYRTFEEAGTSSAAPFVTGGIGLLAQHYRGQLGNDEIVERVLATADSTGEYADSDIYGRGFLDLDAATRPVGGTRMLTGRSLSGPSAPSAASVFHSGAAFGDSLARGLASREVAGFDELDAPFFRPLGDHVRLSRSAVFGLEERLGVLGRDPRGARWRTEDAELRLRLDAAAGSHGVGGARGSAFRGDAHVSGSLGSLSLAQGIGVGELRFGYRVHPGWQFGLHAGDGEAGEGFGSLEPGTFTDDGAFANPFLGFARNGASIGYAAGGGPGAFRIAAFQGTAQYGERRDADAGEAAGFLTEYRLGRHGVAVQAGWLSEAEAAVGARPRGAFGEVAADSVIAGLSAHRSLGAGWTLLTSAHAGISDAETRGHGMVSVPSALWTGSFSLGLVGERVDGAGGRLGFRLSQPLRIEAGHARLRWVSGRTPDGRVTVEEAALALEPSGRQLDFELSWSRPWAGGRAHLAGIVTRDAGHVRGEHEAAVLARYSLSF
ncbi:MAG: S8 family serine peptidase [Chromatiales bacterium]|nr:S8 family serine peptidase [Chromatiales bacterium]